MKNLITMLAVLALFPVLNSPFSTARAQGTAFTFQGRLNDGGAPANGTYDFQFTIQDSATGGSLVAGPVTNTATIVSNGLFITQLDFSAYGSSHFGDADYPFDQGYFNLWLQVGVRTNGSAGAFTNLSPLQLFTSAPFAIQAIQSATADSATEAASVPAGGISGQINLSQISGPVLTNGQNNVQLTGAFSGNAGGVTNLNLPAVTAGGITFTTNFGNFVVASAPGVGSGSAPDFVIAADVNGDGKPDLICADMYGNDVKVLLNNGSGGFGGYTQLYPGLYAEPVSVVAADVNGDGKPDIISANFGLDTLTVFINNGHGGFTLASTLTTGNSVKYVAAADVNGDGKMDLICANYNDGTVSVFTNNGTGGFALASTPYAGAGADSVVAADVNGDGKADLIIANDNGNFGPGTLTVITNNGSGGFVYAAAYGVGNRPFSVTAADINGDNKMDLICANYNDGTLSVLTNDGSGGFAVSSVPVVGTHPQSVIAADVNGDGRPDLISANYGNNTLTILTNNGSGGFVLSASPGAGSGPYSVAAADLNGDGGLDLVSANLNSDNLTVLFNTPTYTANFHGNGSGLTFLSAANLAGTIADARLSSNVALLNASQAFAGANTFGNSGNSFAGAGSGLTGLNASQLTSGTVADGRLSTNAALLNVNQTFTGNPTFAGNTTNSGNTTFNGTNTFLGPLQGANPSASISIIGSVYNSGTYSGFYTYDRGTNDFWTFYARSGRAAFYSNLAGDRVSIDTGGNVRAAGTFFAGQSPDLAETIPAAANVEAGDVVSADPAKPESVVRCSQDAPAVLGVISDGSGGFLINARSESVDGTLTGKPLVLAGRVPVKVSLENGPVRIGDILAPSSLPGVAMRARGTGATVGIALDDFSAADARAGKGTVLCFVKPEDGNTSAAVNEMRTRLEAEEKKNTDLEHRLDTLEKMLNVRH